MEVPCPDPLMAPAGTQLIETMRVEADGALPLLDGHLRRLGHSSQALGFAMPGETLRDAVLARARPLATGHAHRLRLLWSQQGEHQIETAPLPGLAAGQKLASALAPLPSNQPLLQHKTTHRPWYHAAATWLAAHPDYFDVLYFNERDELCEGTRSNIYVLHDGIWLTPPIACGLLPGVQRTALLAADKARAAVLTRKDLAQAKGLRLSNALRGWFDVTLGEVFKA